MAKLYMLKGLPGAGKSHLALEMIAKATRPMKRVNNDELRLMIDGGKWSKENEASIRLVRARMIDEFLSRNYDVIVDNLNLRPADEENYRQVAAMHRAQFEIIDMTDVPLHTCIARDRMRAHPVGEKVIWRWYRDYIAPHQRRRWEEPEGGRKRAILVDLDGTLAEGIGGPNGRGPFEWDKVGQDKPVRPVLEVIRGWQSYYYGTIIFMSGRDEVCRKQTEGWLEGLGFPVVPGGQLDRRDGTLNLLFMRPQGDSRPDTVVKKELFEKYVEPNWHITFVLDDRKSVVQMWRDMGLYVFNCGLDVDF